MKFKKLKLYTSKLKAELKFYTETLGFEIVEQDNNSFTVKIGWTELMFKESDKKHSYHYCFLIPSNKLHQALEWMEKRVEIIDLENGRKTQNFETWNADSFYFFDASGNVAEFIVRYNLANESNADFDISKVLGVNEMGMPTANVKKANDQLEKELKTEFWKGDLERFGTNGNQEGILLLPNYNVKHTWFPTTLKILSEPFEATIDNNSKLYEMEFRNEKLKITQK